MMMLQNDDHVKLHMSNTVFVSSINSEVFVVVFALVRCSRIFFDFI